MGNKLSGLIILLFLGFGIIMTMLVFATVSYYSIVDRLDIIEKNQKTINDMKNEPYYAHPDSLTPIKLPKTINLSPPIGKVSRSDIFLVIIWSCIIGGAGGIGVYLVKLKDGDKVVAHKVLGHAFTCMIAGIIGISASYYRYNEIIIIMSLGYGAAFSLVIAIFDIHEIKEFLSKIFNIFSSKFFGEKR